MAVPTQPNERWSLDFVSDQLASGRRFRVLNIVDNYSRCCVGQLVDTSISGQRLARFLDEVAQLASPGRQQIRPGLVLPASFLSCASDSLKRGQRLF